MMTTSEARLAATAEPTSTASARRDPSADGARSGILLVDKPAGMTSHDAVALVRRAVKTRRVGHTGTLDPFATGLLVVLIGRGTRLIPYIEGEPKVYEATIRFGAETDTDDLAGAIVRESSRMPSGVELAEAIARLTGEIDQLPPAYSAKQIDGVRAYDAARRGAPLELKPSRVVVHAWQLLAREETEVRARITCGSGTYIRALARDLGRLAGSAAHLSTLRRVHSGPFSVDGAVGIDALRGGELELQSLRDGIPSLPVQQVDAADLARVLHGNAIDARVEGTRVAIVDDEQTLIAVADRRGAQFQPKLVLRDA